MNIATGKVHFGGSVPQLLKRPNSRYLSQKVDISRVCSKREIQSALEGLLIPKKRKLPISANSQSWPGALEGFYNRGIIRRFTRIAKIDVLGDMGAAMGNHR